jgi:hypothetical protein
LYSESVEDKIYHKKSDVYSFEILTHEIPWYFDDIDHIYSIASFEELITRKLSPTYD